MVIFYGSHPYSKRKEHTCMYQEPMPQPRDEREWQSSSYSDRPAGSEYDGGYRANPQYDDHLVDAIVQRLRYENRNSTRPGTAASAGMRLALAIVSIVMLIPLTAIILGTSVFAGWITPLALIFLFITIMFIN